MGHMMRRGICSQMMYHMSHHDIINCRNNFENLRKVTRDTLMNLLRNSMPTRHTRGNSGVQNLTLEEEHAQKMMSRFKVRLNLRKVRKQPFARTLHSRTSTQKSIRDRIGSKLLPTEFLGQIKEISEIFKHLVG